MLGGIRFLINFIRVKRKNAIALLRIFWGYHIRLGSVNFSSIGLSNDLIYGYFSLFICWLILFWLLINDYLHFCLFHIWMLYLWNLILFSLLYSAPFWACDNLGLNLWVFLLFENNAWLLLQYFYNLIFRVILAGVAFGRERIEKRSIFFQLIYFLLKSLW